MVDRWEASENEMLGRDVLAQYVDTDLHPDEQETSISFFGRADRFKITTYSPPMVRKLLRHSYAEIEWVYQMDGGEQGVRRELPSESALEKARPRIEGVCATLPLGALTIKGKPRKQDHHSDIVTTPSDLEGLDDVFGGDDDGE